jgi:hypothetical protein
MAMMEREALSRMIPPGMCRPGTYRGGVIQIHVTRACDKACFGCTQASNLAGPSPMTSPKHFEQAVVSLKDYFGVVGVFGGNPALHPQFELLCQILKEHVPFSRRGLWCNHPHRKGEIMRRTFDPSISNLNVHLDRAAYAEFRRDWPESRPFGLEEDSRHGPPYVAMQDVVQDEGDRWRLISGCDINQHWSAMVCVFRGELRAYFCEIAGAQAMLHQYEADYPDYGLSVVPGWWRRPMVDFADQVRYHCHRCGVPLRGYGQLSQATAGVEQTSKTHRAVYRPKRTERMVQVIEDLNDLGEKRVNRFIDYLGNAKR